MPRSTISLLVAITVGLVACGSGADNSVVEPATGEQTTVEPTVVEPPVTEQRFPDVIDAQAREMDGTWTFDVTISSPYDSAERYADAWRVVGPSGEQLGIRVLTHDHATEQPFTRSLQGVKIADNVDTVTIEARDQQFGWGGTTLDVQLR